MLETFRFAKEALLKHWDRAPGWGTKFGTQPLDGTIGCLYTMVNDHVRADAKAGRFATTLSKAIGDEYGEGFYWAFDRPNGREEVLQAIERTIAQLEETEGVPEGSDSNQVAPVAFANAGCGMEPVT